MKKRKPLLLYLLLAILFFLGMGGIYGGVALIADPSGKMIGLSIGYINKTVFANYLVPGIILTILNGMFPLLIFYSLLKRPLWQWPGKLNIYKERHWAWTFSLYAGIILVTWMNVQILVVGYWGNIQVWFGLLGISIVIITLTPVVMDQYAMHKK